jgi:hypothetical protein
MPNYHLVILKRPYLNAILTGQKSVECRITKTKRYEFGRVFSGDILFLKESSGPVCAKASVASVKNFPNLTPRKLNDIRQQYNHLIKADNAYWQSKADSTCGFLVWLKDVIRIKPVRISKRDWRAWVVLTEKENFGLLKAATGKNEAGVQ